MANKKVKTKKYVSCERCEKNNWDTPEFWGCPRGSCEIEIEGTIIISKKLIKTKPDGNKI